MSFRILPFFSLVLLLVLMVGAAVRANPVMENCPVTTPTTELPNEAYIASWSSRWYRSDDGELWADAGLRFADGVKVGWRKPLGAALEVTGRRLDGDAPPLTAEVPDGYADHFQASGLIFPTAGCWEVEARSADSTLTFVTAVFPKAYASPGWGNACDSIPQLVNASTVVLLGTVEGDYADPLGGFVWQTVHVERLYKGRLGIGGERVEVLRGTPYEPLMERGSSYLLFLQASPGRHIQVLCPLAQVEGDHITVEAGMEWGVLKSGLLLDDLITAIRAAEE
jgi:hypothetical protein